MTIRSLREMTREGNSSSLTIEAQVEKILLKETSSGKPFYELVLRDATGTLSLRAWSEKPSFLACQKLAKGEFVEITGNFTQNSFGLDATTWSVQTLDEEKINFLLEGSLEEQRTHQADYELLLHSIDSLQDPRLQMLCQLFLKQYGKRFRRAAAARSNHHARRGGLLEHTARMMRSLLALHPVYPQLHRDLLITGILFHDSGKLWETCPLAQGFEITPHLRGELLGHLSIGIELVNALWRELPKETWSHLLPADEEVRLHLLHLIASHHGLLEYGSPILPKTPEAMVLHLLDNLDARFEMFQEAYAQKPSSDMGLFEWSRPLGVAPVVPLREAEFKKTEE